MFWITCNAIAIFLSIIGLVEIIRIFVLMLLKTNSKNGIIIIVPICGHNEEAELLLRSAATRVEWSFNTKYQKVICLDLGMDDETRKICEIICAEYNFMKIYSTKEFEESLKI